MNSCRMQQVPQYLSTMMRKQQARVETARRRMNLRRMVLLGVLVVPGCLNSSPARRTDSATAFTTGVTVRIHNVSGMEMESIVVESRDRTEANFGTLRSGERSVPSVMGSICEVPTVRVQVDGVLFEHRARCPMRLKTIDSGSVSLQLDIRQKYDKLPPALSVDLVCSVEE